METSLETGFKQHKVPKNAFLQLLADLARWVPLSTFMWHCLFLKIIAEEIFRLLLQFDIFACLLREEIALGYLAMSLRENIFFCV